MGEEPTKLREWLARYERESRFLIKDSDQRKVLEEVFDTSTLLSLKELIKKGALSDIYGSIRSGKEAKVFLGIASDRTPRAVKIYLTVAAGFRKRYPYISGDPRFGKLPTNSRETIYLWVRKEFKNMQLASSKGVRVPKPYAFNKNIIVMEFIGDPPEPAPTFAETEVELEDFKWVVETIKKLYRDARLVHADLSEYNVFKFKGERIIFDFGSAVITSHPNAETFLRRDVENMVRFFRRRGISYLETEQIVEEVVE
jgi:RIO kinase 1